LKYIHLFANSNTIKRKEKLQKISDFLPSDYSDYGAFSSDYGAKMLATFRKKPATFQRLWRNPRKIRKFPEKWEEI
jgi:hypothetical protein